MISKNQKKFASDVFSKYQKTQMAVGTVQELDGYWKDKYEKFLGAKLPKVKIPQNR